MTTPQQALIDMVPQEWFMDSEKSSIWITAFRILLADKEKFGVNKVYDYEKLRVNVVYGKLQYLDLGHTKQDIDHLGEIRLDVNPKHQETPESGWLIILQPYVVDGVELKENEIRIKAGTYSALYAVLNGRNMAFERTFDIIASLKDGGTSAFSPSFLNPNAFSVPDVSKERCETIYKVGKAMEQIPKNDRHRIELALHWYEKGMRAVGLDTFVNYWIAIETLGMPDTTNIHPLNQCLADAYGLSLEEATIKFGIGKIFGLRSRILHGGEYLPINQLLEEYMESIFADILLSLLQKKSERKAVEVLQRSNFDLNKLVHVSG